MARSSRSRTECNKAAWNTRHLGIFTDMYPSALVAVYTCTPIAVAVYLTELLSRFRLTHWPHTWKVHYLGCTHEAMRLFFVEFQHPHHIQCIPLVLILQHLTILQRVPPSPPNSAGRCFTRFTMLVVLVPLHKPLTLLALPNTDIPLLRAARFVCIEHFIRLLIRCHFSINTLTHVFPLAWPVVLGLAFISASVLLRVLTFGSFLFALLLSLWSQLQLKFGLHFRLPWAVCCWLCSYFGALLTLKLHCLCFFCVITSSSISFSVPSKSCGFVIAND